MTFMQQQIRLDRWFEVETEQGTSFIPQDLIGKTLNPSKSDVADYVEGNEIYSIKVIDGYGARLSAPGYLDCTEWNVFKTEQEAREWLISLEG